MLRKMLRNFFLRLSLALILFCALIASGKCVTFRVENTVTITPAETRGGNTMPTVAVSQMIFIDYVVYNFIDAHGEITVYDPQSDLFVLIDPALRIQHRLRVKDLRESVDKKLESLVDYPQPLVAFAAKPIFSKSLDVESGVKKFSSEWIEYEIQTSPLTDAATKQAYYSAADAFCYLNFRVMPGPRGLIYLVRLAVNRSLAEQNRFPDKVNMTFYPKGKEPFASSERRQSEHKLTPRLSENDKRRLDQAQEMMKTFRQVDFDTYQAEVEKKLQNVLPIPEK